MFFEGSVAEAISAAMQQSKLLVSFVADDGTESQEWEGYLADGSIASTLQGKAITLKLRAGSQDAGFLAAMYPLPKTPTIVIMLSNGQLQDYIASGTSKTDLLSRVAKALGASNPATSSSLPTSTGAPAETPAREVAPAGGDGHSESHNEDGSAPASNLQEQLAERSARLTAQREKAAEEAKEAARKRKEKGKAKAEEPEPASDGEAPQAGKPQTEKAKAAKALRQKKLEAAEERKRILKQIEHDRAERKARDEQRKLERQAVAMEADAAEGEDVTETAPVAMTPILASRRHEYCALQVRLFDGSTIRTRLPSSNDVRTGVRQWVDEERGGDRSPYTFRVIFPNRLIDETEEDQSLADLGLTPSSTLVLVPVTKFSSAYDDADAGILQRLIAKLTHFFTMILTFFTSIFTGAGQPAQVEPTGQSLGLDRPAESTQNRAKTLRDLQRDQQLYNGNSLNFEPRRDDEENDENT